MSKDNSDYLFALIQSLGKAEKRHFKVYSSKHVIGSENNYVRLFDLVESQRNYDEPELKKKFVSFPSLKTRLYNAILRSLEEYHSGVSMDLKSLMNQIEILFNRSLYVQCSKQILKAKSIAERHELYELGLEILKWEIRTVTKMADRIRLKKVLDEETYFLKQLNNQKTYRDIAINLSIKYNQYGSERTAKNLNEMKKLMRSPFLADRTKALSIRARQNFHDSHSLYAITTGDYETIYKESKEMLDLYHNNTHIIHMYAGPYLGTLNSFLIAVQGLKKYDEMKKYLEDLNVVRKHLRSSAERSTAFFYMYHYMNYFILTGSFSEAKEPIKELVNEIDTHLKSLNQHQKTMLYITFAQVYFGQEQYKRSLFWLNKIILLGEMKARKDIECFVRIFFLLVHYEMKSDSELMGSLFRSTYRFLSKRERLYKFESAIMDFIKKNLLEDIDQRNIKKQFIKLRAKLVLIAKDPQEHNLLDYFDFISWLESKIQNRSFAAVVRSKNDVNEKKGRKI